MRRFRLTAYFVITALSVIVVAAAVVNKVVGDLAQENLIRTAEENTARDAVHMQAMMRRGHGGRDMPSMGNADGGVEMGSMRQPIPLSLEYLTGPDGLPGNYPMLVEGLSIVKLNLFDLNGTTVWSTDPNTIGITKRESPLFRDAVGGEFSSKLAEDHEVVHLDGVTRPVDVVETYLPLRETREGRIIGVMEVYRDIAGDVAIQVDDAEATVLRTTVATMGGLFLVLVGFVVVADIAIYRARRREVALVEGQLAERERSEEALEQQARELARSNAELEEFARVASHDLQEPLRMVTSFTQLLSKRYKGRLDEEGDKYISFAADGATRMSALISDLLTYSRVGSGTRGFGPTDCEAVLDSALDNLQIAIRESGVALTRGPLPEVVGDKTQLVQLFQNLIGNAIKYQDGRAPQVHVGADRVDDGWLFSVRDNGIGIDPDQYERIFSIFQRLHTSEEYPGTGVGLALCKKISERHGGRIWVESEPGTGSTFYVMISATGEESEGVAIPYEYTAAEAAH